jgi:hypothetical protein
MKDAGINNVIYMELYSGPKMANAICGKTIDTGTIDRGSTVFVSLSIPYSTLFQSGLLPPTFRACAPFMHVPYVG